MNFMYNWHRVSYKYFDFKDKAEQFIESHKNQSVYDLSYCGNFMKPWCVTRHYKTKGAKL